jgi:short-subunit dehydrogenase
MEVNNKIIIVTGASMGIGLAAARLLSKQGAKVALVARSADKLKKLAQELPDSLAVPADMTKAAEIKKMIAKVQDHYGRVDILINNAGQGYAALVEKTDIEIYRRLLELNVLGPLMAMQEVIPLMRKQGGGMIVNISSGTALGFMPMMGAYSSTKRVLSALTMTAREELAADKIILSAVYPYITDTDFFKNGLHNENKAPGAAHAVPNIQGRPAADTPEFVAEKILEAIQSEKPEILVHDWMKNFN